MDLPDLAGPENDVYCLQPAALLRIPLGGENRKSSTRGTREGACDPSPSIRAKTKHASSQARLGAKIVFSQTCRGLAGQAFWCMDAIRSPLARLRTRQILAHCWIATIVTLNLCASAAVAEPAVETKGTAWPDTIPARVEVLALIETLNAQLLCASCTVTEVLEKWCADHKLAIDPTVHARRIGGLDRPISPDQRQRLQIGPGEKVIYRHVELTCGGHVLVEADNWYVPRRVGDEINKVLTTTDTPFGRAVRSLNPVRKNLSVEIVWKPLPDGWELGSVQPERPGEALAMPWQLFEHRAVIYNDKQQPFSEVREIFTREVLAFGPP